MIRFLQRSIKAIAARWGVVMFKRSTGLYLPEEDMPRVVYRLCGKTNPLIVDGGAHQGGFVRAIRRVSPSARFICFEPTPALVSDLNIMFSDDANVTVVPIALGDSEGTARFHLNSAPSTNSLLASADQTTGELSALINTQEMVDVEVATMDAALARLNQTDVDIIKFDLQGHDYRALLGSTQTLKRTAVVVVEVWFAPVYEGAGDYLQVCSLMDDKGFALYSLTSLHYGNNDRLLWGDAIFVPRNSPAWRALINN